MMKARIEEINMNIVSKHLLNPAIVYYELKAKITLITEMSNFVPEKPRYVTITNTFTDPNIKKLYDKYVGNNVELGYIDGIYPILGSSNGR